MEAWDKALCGIIGIAAQPAKNKLQEKLIKGLHALEYRGYDSAGIAVLVSNQIKLEKSVGNVKVLEQKLIETKCIKFHS